MRTRGWLGLTLLIGCVSVAAGRASDPMGVYARVDRVVLEPNGDAPQTMQVWGVFAMAERNDPDQYRSPARGYLLFKLPDNARAARAEWADFSQVAGTGQIVAFASRYELNARVRPDDERPASPDAYSLNFGLTKVRGRTDYAPVRVLNAFRN